MTIGTDERLRKLVDQCDDEAATALEYAFDTKENWDNAVMYARFARNVLECASMIRARTASSTREAWDGPSEA